jgi:Flavodoxin domain
MKAVIIYESMYGNTRTIAYAISEGLRPTADVTVASAAQATQELVRGADLVVVGAPTHVHGLSRPVTRRGAIDAARTSGSCLTLDPTAGQPGLREWLAGLGYGFGATAAAFDTRLTGPALVTGRAAKTVTRLLRRHDFTVLARPESFLVTRDNKLRAGESRRAQEWGAALAARLATERVRS